MVAAPRLPPPGRRGRPAPAETDVHRLATLWSDLALAPVHAPAVLQARLVALLQRIAARCRDEPFWPARARTLGGDLLRSGLCGEARGPLHPAEDVLAPTLALLRERGPDALDLSGTARHQLPTVLDQLAVGFATALRDRVHGEHEELLRTRLAQAAAQDALTRLPNRTVAEEWARRAFAGGPPVRAGVCAVDLDGFAAVNDRLGRDVGDRLLVAVAARLRQAVAPSLLVRTGGDEFAVLVDDADDPAAVHALGRRVGDALRSPFLVGTTPVTLSAAVGVAVATPATAGPAGLMRAAEVALSWAKARGPGRTVEFDPVQDAADAARVTLLDDLDAAVGRGELRLHYQPLVALSDGRVRGVEALVRWQHPEHGLLEPGRFVAAAEGSGAIVPVGWWVLEEACARAAECWRAHGPASPWVSVNVSPVELAQPGWADGVLRVIDVTRLPPARLQLEITEQAALSDGPASLAALRTVREAGVRLALDDFGTGHAGLTWLRWLPVHAIKIDGSFVDGLRHADPDPVDAAIVAAVIRMAHELDLEVTAEWVETARQVEHLTVLGCDLGQGRWWGGAGFLDAVADRDAGRVAPGQSRR